jgi:5-methylcytosine-specific restriction protein A
MTNKFNDAQLAFFDAEDGAFSPISAKDEASKRQITLTGHEKEIVVAYFGRTIFNGSVRDPSGKGRKEFIHHNTGAIIQLGLVYPKLKRPNELRLYMSGDFGGDASDVWYLFKRQDRLHIGTMPSIQWKDIGKADYKDDLYQQAVQNYQSVPPEKRSSIVSSFPRSAAIACAAIEKANFKCSIDPGHKTFLTKSGIPYMEAHHIIPLSEQEKFGTSIDTPDNIICLCPNCHRFIHHGKREEKERALNTLYDQRKAFLTSGNIGLSLNQLLDMY